MGNAASGEGVPNATAMRILGGIMILLSIVEFGIGGAVYAFLTNVHLGAWWAAICPFIAGVMGVISTNNSVVITGCVFSIIGVIIGVVGSIVDGISAAILAAEKGCVNTDTGEGWGSSQAQFDSAICYFNGDNSYYGYFYNYYYNRPYNYYNNNFYYNHPNRNGNDDYFSYQCVCSDNSVCFGYNLSSGDNCGSILTTYTNLLGASTAFVVVITVITFTYSIFTCMGCSQNGNATPPQPVVVQLSSPQPQYTQVVQPGQPIVYAGTPQAAQPVVYAGQPAYVQQPVVYPGQPVAYGQQPVVYAMAPQEEKAMVGVVVESSI